PCRHPRPGTAIRRPHQRGHATQRPGKATSQGEDTPPRPLAIPRREPTRNEAQPLLPQPRAQGQTTRPPSPANSYSPDRPSAPELAKTPALDQFLARAACPGRHIPGNARRRHSAGNNAGPDTPGEIESAERSRCRKRGPRTSAKTSGPDPTEPDDRCADSKAELVGSSSAESAGTVRLQSGPPGQSRSVTARAAQRALPLIMVLCADK